MDLSADRSCSAFAGTERIASGHLAFVAGKVKALLDAGDTRSILIIDNQTSDQIEVDFRGTQGSVAEQFTYIDPTPPPKPGRGRPKLGVVSREITLHPRHWAWLERQGKPPSAVLRHLVEMASRANQQEDAIRAAQTAVYRFLTTFAPHLNEYEEVLRALYQRDGESFEMLVQDWPRDIVAHLKKIAPPAFNSQ